MLLTDNVIEFDIVVMSIPVLFSNILRYFLLCQGETFRRALMAQGYHSFRAGHQNLHIYRLLKDWSLTSVATVQPTRDSPNEKRSQRLLSIADH